MIEQLEAVNIAKKHAKALGYKVSSMSIEFEKCDKPVNRWVSEKRDSSYILERKKLLEGKVYWAIYLGPIKRQFGGDICVFVDANTGEVISNIRGK